MAYCFADAMTKVVKRVDRPKCFSLSHPSKISTSDNCAFSLPAGPKFSCPGATEACAGCYATKGRHVFESVQSVFARNWLLIRYCERYNKMDMAVSLISNTIKKDATIFRIHESGDFHSQWAINMWSKIIKERSSVLFWAYTRSFMFNYSGILKNTNFTLWASTDNCNMKKAEKFVKRYQASGVRHAYGPWEHDAELPPQSFICPVTNHVLEMNGACERCKLCIMRDRTPKNVVFLAH
jgi:hypothetical protein